MAFDPRLLQMLLTQPDDKLWATVRQIAKKNGITLKETTPPPTEMQKIRALLQNADKMSSAEAKAIIENLKRNGGDAHG